MAYNVCAMEPRIQYAKTSDGVSIAFHTMGKGTPLVMAGAPAALSEPLPEQRIWLERLARRREVVRYDHRGFGLSERKVSDYSVDALVRDLEAVTDRLGFERFALFTAFVLGPVAITYAVRHPERISHLLLWCTWARASAAYRSPHAQAIMALRESDWEDYTEATARLLFTWSEAEKAHRYAAQMREGVTREGWLAFTQASGGFDVMDPLSDVRAPTLVLHRRQIRFPELESARELASGIQDARLVVLEGQSILPALGDTEAVVAAIDEFLGEGEEAAAAAELLASRKPAKPKKPKLAKQKKRKAATPSGLATILFTDVEGSTALTQRLGDAKAREVLRQHERIVREALKSHGGSEVKTTGDGFMTSFSSATRALESAIAMQRAFAAHNEAAAARPSTGSGRAEVIRVRIGLNAGEPIAEEEDLFGTGVNLAARICGPAEAGQILASDVVRQLVAGKDFLFADRGEVRLRGFDEPVRLFEVRWEG